MMHRHPAATRAQADSTKRPSRVAPPPDRSPIDGDSNERSACHSRHLLEMLERRVMLSATAAVPNDLHNIQSGPLAKAGGNLANLYLGYRAAQRGNTLSTFESQAAAQTNSAAGSPLDVTGATVGVEVVGTGSLSSLESSVKAIGLSIQSITPKDNAVGGFIPITMLSQLAQTSDVLHVTPLVKPIVYQEGEAPNQADQALNAVGARSTFSVTGAGISVGVISDSVSQYAGGLADSVRTGDLPNNVTVIQDGQPGDTDEGRAILEEIYDLAPGAKLYFDAVGDSQQSFASAVAALQAAGCNVIIDDVGFIEEPFFQPGVIDAAIDTAVNSGVTYVTAAGNSGNSGFEQAATFVAATDGSGDELINFNAGGTAATRMNMTVTQPGTLTFEWDDAYDGVTGTVKADLDINLYNANGTRLVYSGNDNTFQTGVPVQEIPDVAAGTYQVEIVAVNTPTADLPGYYEFNIESDSGSDIGSVQYAGLRTTVVGHSAFSEAISVGAVAFSDTPAFTANTPIPTEDFSSQGPAIEARDANGDLLGTAQTIDVPNVSGSDGNNTSFFPAPPDNTTPTDPTNFPQFFGTSAAAGNVAAVVALMKQADPGATSAQVLASMEATATPVNGQAADTYNPSGGYGLVNATAAISNLLSGTTGSGGTGGGGGTTALPPAAFIISPSPNPRSTPVSSIDIDFNEPVIGFTISDLVLSLNGGANLLTSNQTLSTTNNQDYVLNNLAAITTTYGEYVLTLDATGSGITGTNGAALQVGASTSFLTEAITGLPGTPTHLAATSNSTTVVALTFVEPAGNGLEGFDLQRATNPAFTGKVTNITLHSNSAGYTDTNLTPGTVYYYRIEAINSVGVSAFSHAATVITYAAGEVIMDNSATSGVTIGGSWQSSSAIPGYDGSNYLQDGDADKGDLSVKYHPDLATAGEYAIYATWTTASNRATNVPFDIYSTDGDLLETVRVNERSKGGDGWVLLGDFFLHSSTASLVRIRNTGTNGEVVADAIKFLPVNSSAIERNDGQLVLPTATATASAAHVAAVASVAPTPAAEDNELKSLREEVE